jgi:hypothetical protein
MKWLYWILVLAGLLAVLGGCLQSPPAGYLEGDVTLGPICPVEQENVTCPVPPEAYAMRKIVVSRENSGEVAVVDIDSKGWYRVSLSPGSYQVDINYVGIDHSDDVPTRVIIIAGQTTVLNISIDTGIR